MKHEWGERRVTAKATSRDEDALALIRHVQQRQLRE